MKTTALNKVATSRANDALAPSHEEIAVEAEVLWRQRGCPENRDEEIWLEAERQLFHVARTYRMEQDEEALSDPLSRLDHKSDDVMGELEELDAPTRQGHGRSFRGFEDHIRPGSGAGC